MIDCARKGGEYWSIWLSPRKFLTKFHVALSLHSAKTRRTDEERAVVGAKGTTGEGGTRPDRKMNRRNSLALLCLGGRKVLPRCEVYRSEGSKRISNRLERGE